MGSDIPDEFKGSYYNRDYFVTPEGKKYKGSDGEIHGWSYGNETGDWDGAYHITKAWKEARGDNMPPAVFKKLCSDVTGVDCKEKMSVGDAQKVLDAVMAPPRTPPINDDDVPF